MRERITQKKARNIDRENSPFFLLFLLITFLAVSLVWWVLKDKTPPHWDMSNHLMNALGYSEGIQEKLKSGILGPLKAVKYLLFHYTYYPPLLYLVSLPITFFSRDMHSLILVNIFFMYVFGFSIYLIAKEYTSKWFSVLIAFASLTLPIPLSQTQQYQLDFPLTAVTTTALYFLLKSNFFSERKFSILFGITAGLGMLLKWPIMAFLLPPAIYLFLSGTKKFGFKKTSINLFYAVAGGAVIAGPWYLCNLETIMRDFRGNLACGAAEGDPSVLSKQSFVWYLRVFPFEYIRAFYLPFFFTGLTWIILKIRRKGTPIFLLVTLLGGYIIMTVFRNKDFRFIMPLSGIAMIISFWWVQYVPKYAKMLISLVAIVIAIFLFVSVRFGIKWIPEKVILYTSTATGDIPLFRQTGYFSDQPRSTEWPNEDIVKSIASFAEFKHDFGGRVAIDYYDEPYFNKENLQFFARANRLKLSVSYPYPPSLSLDCINDDFLIVQDSPKGPPNFHFIDDKYFDENNNVYCKRDLLREDTLPDGRTVTTYKISEPSPN